MYSLKWLPMLNDGYYVKYISYDTQWHILSYLNADDLMELRSASKTTFMCIQKYALIMADRQEKFMNPYNIFARSILYNSYKVIERVNFTKKVNMFYYCTVTP